MKTLTDGIFHFYDTLYIDGEKAGVKNQFFVVEFQAVKSTINFIFHPSIVMVQVDIAKQLPKAFRLKKNCNHGV